MQKHNITLNKAICDELIEYIKQYDSLQHTERLHAPCVELNAKVDQSKDRISLHVKARLDSNRRDNTPIVFFDNREELILENYQNHQESEYIKYSNQIISNAVPQEVFDHFNLNRYECKIYVHRLKPGKILVPHKDYYITFNHGTHTDKNASTLGAQPIKNVIRLWISLSGKKFGHILIIEEDAIYWQEQGTIITWNKDELHTAANLGYEDRYIMIITGAVVNK